MKESLKANGFGKDILPSLGGPLPRKTRQLLKGMPDFTVEEIRVAFVEQHVTRPSPDYVCKGLTKEEALAKTKQQVSSWLEDEGPFREGAYLHYARPGRKSKT